MEHAVVLVFNSTHILNSEIFAVSHRRFKLQKCNCVGNVIRGEHDKRRVGYRVANTIGTAFTLIKNV